MVKKMGQREARSDQRSNAPWCGNLGDNRSSPPSSVWLGAPSQQQCPHQWGDRLLTLWSRQGTQNTCRLFLSTCIQQKQVSRG